MRTIARSWVVLGLIAGLVSGCSATDNLSNKVDGVDRAVALLQDVDDNGAWQTIADGLDSLVASGSAFQATFTLNEKDASTDATPAKVLTASVQVNPDGAAWITIEQSGSLEHFYMPALTGTAPPETIYRVEDERFYCVNEPDTPGVLTEGLASLFEPAALDTAIRATLAVIEEDGDMTVAKRKATRYTLTPKLDEALAILADFEQITLRERVKAAGQFALAGHFALDDDTGALSQLTAVVEDVQTGQITEITFEVTAWAIEAGFTPPGEEMIDQPCP